MIKTVSLHTLASTCASVYDDDTKNMIIVDDAEASITFVDAHTAILCFRGTEIDEAEDVFADLDIVPHHLCDELKVHGGFYTYENKLHDHIMDELENYGIDTVHATGHSLGGAMAVIFALRLVLADNTKIKSCTTFGQPSVIALDSVEYAQSVLLSKVEYTRVVNNNDIVPCVYIPWYNYTHINHEFLVDHENDGSSRRVWYRFASQFIDGIGDHSIAAYVSALSPPPRRPLSFTRRTNTRMVWCVCIGVLLFGVTSFFMDKHL